MTRAQAEANWGWDPRLGSTRPKEWKNRRPRLTSQNIREQQKLARPGTLIHSVNSVTCSRKKKGTDVRKDGNVTHTAVAGFIDNVNCLWCRRDFFKYLRK